MPRLNHRGDIGAGIGGLQVSINRQVIASPAGESEWMNDDELAYVDHAGFIMSADASLRKREIANGSANTLRAGGGLAAWSVRELVQGIERWVTRFSDGRPHALDVVIAGIGPDGVPHFVENGLTHGVHAATFQALSGGRWAATRFPDYRPVDGPGVTPAMLPDGPIYGLRRSPDERFIVYSTDDGRIRVQHLTDVTRGYFVRQDGVVVRSDAFRPDIAVLPDGTIKIAYSITEGEIPSHVRDFVIDPAWLVEDMRNPAQPDPDPDPDPDPEPVTMKMPSAVFATVKAFYDRFGLPAGEEEQRAHQRRCCETVRARHGAKWGHKRADPNRPPSADALACLDSERLFIWDCVSDAGGPDRKFALVDGQEGLDVTGQIFIGVDPVDHLAGEPDPDPDPDPDPAYATKAYVDTLVGDHVSSIMEAMGHQFAAQAEEIGKLKTRVKDLEDAPSDGTFDPARYKARTRVSFLGTFEGSIEPR